MKDALIRLDSNLNETSMRLYKLQAVDIDVFQQKIIDMLLNPAFQYNV